MPTLDTTLRRQLERTVGDARQAAEAGAKAALHGLAISEPAPYDHMDADQRELRRRLRAHARQLGDQRNPTTGEQTITRLVHECAYEHWHGMLFARFLAENDLLMEPDLGVALSLDECEELAKAEADGDKWRFAARLAHAMLPQVFRPDHPAFEVRLAPEHRLTLERLVESVPEAVFKASDSLGWVYQFWQSRRKAEVNRSEAKIGADELPAVTQLFTEPYMVSFLLDNALGAWWAARRLNAHDLRNAATEQELRDEAALPGMPLDYLRFVREGDGPWQPAAGAFDAWPNSLGELKVMDPCCGSGHFLVAAFTMLVPMRMAREGLSVREAVDAVLRDNLHGLELDPRCVELAAFALALAAWTYPGTGGYRPLPTLNVACSGLSVGVARERWLELADGDNDLRIALDWLYDEFHDAPLLGSLLDPTASEAAKIVNWRKLSAALDRALSQHRPTEQRETAIAALGLARSASLLTGRYDLVTTNVPYLARGRQDERLRAFCDERYSTARKDLATTFLERCLALCPKGGVVSVVIPQNWLFLGSYRKFRTKLLKTETWRLMARLGPGAFETISGEVVQVALLTFHHASYTTAERSLFRAPQQDNLMAGLDVSVPRDIAAKSEALRRTPIKTVAQRQQLDNPDHRVTLDPPSAIAPLSRIANGVHGFGSKDSPCFFRQFWEIADRQPDWDFLQTTVRGTSHWHGCQQVVYWQGGRGALAARGRVGLAVPAGGMAWGKSGVSISQMQGLPSALYSGAIFDKNVAVVTPNDPSHLTAVWCFASSPAYNVAVRRIDQKLNVTNSTLVKVPFDLDHWQRVADSKYPNGLPQPFSDDPTQWIYHGHPTGSVVWDEEVRLTVQGAQRTDPGVLQVAVARLLGYRWPAETDPDIELAPQQREWVTRCEALLPFADADGIVCIPSVRGEPPAAERLYELLRAAYADAWDDDVLNRLLAAIERSALDDWLRDRFFHKHCKLFHDRPFIWHVWDGRKRDGFHALVNYHRLAEPDGKGRQCLEALTYSYLGDWISRQQDGVKRGESGAEDRLTAATLLQQRLEAILEGQPPFDIFVRWKPVQEQPIGWNPDINDGVRLNIRPFMIQDFPGTKKGAGILRDKPNIHWRKDRGKEPQYAKGRRPASPPEGGLGIDVPEELRPERDFPWFWDHGEFAGERVNDVHLTLAERA